MKIDISPYKHFSFDLWLTLIKSNPLFKQKRTQLLIDYFAIKLEFEKVIEIIRYYDVLSNKICERTGKHIGKEEIYFLILNKIGVDIEQINKKALTEFYNETEKLFMAYKPQLIYPNIHRLFKEIAIKEKTISILSNTAFIEGTMLRWLLEHYELSDYFSFQLYSDEIGFSKPNQQVFDMVFKKVNDMKPISRGEIVHIGDNKTADFSGATKAGLQSILIKN